MAVRKVVNLHFGLQVSRIENSNFAKDVFGKLLLLLLVEREHVYLAQVNMLAQHNH